jgi:C-terminal peptidase prc
MPLRSLVLDLRGNAGGSFTAGVRTAERFVPSGILVTTRGQAPEVADRVFSSAAGMTAFDLPLVVLVDTRTMSSAEIVAAALKGQSRAELVGLPTFGKGVVQCPFRLTAADLPAARPPRGSGVLIVTIAKAFAPTGEPIHGVGVVPHVIEADPDRQLAVAVERAAMLAGMR